MTIDRRHLLSSLASAALCPSVVTTVNASASSAQASTNHQDGHTPEGWFLAKQFRPQHKDHALDFWARPFSDISYCQYLPSEIVRGAIWYDTFDKPDSQTPESIDRSFQNYRFDWAEKPRRLAACSNGPNTLASVLRSLIADDASHSTARTALLSLDSLGPLREPSWADVLPAFRSCYERIIGHFHLERRGLRQWRECLNASFPAGYFQQFFTDAVSQCDAVILTSAGLCESDVRCDPCASTEELAGELMRDLGCALLTPAVLDRIVGVGTAPRRPRMFALASLHLWTPESYDFDFPRMFNRQGELVRGSFGEGIGERPLLVAAAAEDVSRSSAAIRLLANESFFTTDIPVCEVEKSCHSIFNYLRMITLWPFQLHAEEPRAA